VYCARGDKFYKKKLETVSPLGHYTFFTPHKGVPLVQKQSFSVPENRLPMAFAAKKDIKKKKRDSRGSPLSADSSPSSGGLGTTQWLNRSLTLLLSSTMQFVTQWSVSAAIRGPEEQVVKQA
jgi:hypothetical protein